MSRVMGFMSKTKDQMEEYKKIKNDKFDKKILKAEAKTQNLKLKKAKFNEEIDEVIKNIKD